jgi:hypothetical protein
VPLAALISLLLIVLPRRGRSAAPQAVSG